MKNSNIRYSSVNERIKSWPDNSIYPINNVEKLIETFISSLNIIYETNVIKNKTADNNEYKEIYNNVMLNPIFDSHPIEFNLSDNSDLFIKDISAAILMSEIFDTIETKNAYLISLAVAFKKIASKNLDEKVINKASLMIYETIFSVENPNSSYVSLKEGFQDEYKYLDDGQALALQIHYHRWMIINKSILPNSSYMRNRFINIVIRKNFPKHTPNVENKTETSYAVSYKKLHEEISNHLKIKDTKLDISEWIDTFVNNVMLVYYGYYKWDKLRGDFYEVINLEKNVFGKKIPISTQENADEFSKFIKF